MSMVPGLKDDATFAEKREFIEKLAFFPALLILIFIRRKMGFRMLKPVWLTSMGWILILLPLMFREAAQPLPFVLPLFGVAMVAIGFFERQKRWCEICGGVRWHTYSPGISYFERLPLPPVMFGCRRIYRFLDPLLCLGLSMIGALLSHALGSVLFLCAVSVFIYENALFEGMLKRDLDILDGLIESEIQGEIVKSYEGPQPEEKQRTLEQTAGIPTGVAPDIQKQVELRKAKRKAAPDNLVRDVAEVPA